MMALLNDQESSVEFDLYGITSPYLKLKLVIKFSVSKLINLIYTNSLLKKVP